jgi:hypothetical protein
MSPNTTPSAAKVNAESLVLLPEVDDIKNQLEDKTVLSINLRAKPIAE